MKKSLFLIILSAICCITLTGCTGNRTAKKSDSKTQEESSHSTEKDSDVTSPTPTATKEQETEQDSTQVCFIGNSLIDYGNQSNFLIDLAAGYNKKISVDKITWGGAHLSDYIAGTFVKKKTIKKRLNKADIVVFQDYGGWQGTETLNSIQKLIKWCKKDSSLYYYMYDGDDDEMQTSDYKELAELGMELIPKGQMIDALFEMTYTYEDLHIENDFHPNNFNGYLAALVMNSTIFDFKCTELSKEWFLGEKDGQLAAAYAQVLDGLHGESEHDKWNELQKICKKADQLVQDIKQ